MALTDVKKRRHPNGTLYLVKVEDQVVSWMDDQNYQTWQVAFSLPAGAKTQVGFEIWSDGLLEVTYIPSAGDPVSVRSGDCGRAWH